MANTPEFYSDSLQVMDNTVTASLIARCTPAVLGPSVPEAVAVIRLPLAVLKIHAFQLRKYILDREKAQGEPIAIPRGALQAASIPFEDWTAFWKHDEALS